MVAPVSSGVVRAHETRALRCVLALCCTAPWAGAMGQSGLADPTRPPMVARSAGSDAAADAAAPVLQAILIVRDRRSAVISGQTVTVGAHYGAMRVVQIGETEVVLKSPEGATTLKLFPEVEKKTRRGDVPMEGKTVPPRTGVVTGKSNHAG